MVIAFCPKYRNLRLVAGSQVRERSRDGERGKVICIARGSKARLDQVRLEPQDEPEWEPPIGA